ncbi:MAG: FG-GAP-like repeat-containing protein [Candidatus Krumholzibacteriia bacterium]
MTHPGDIMRMTPFSRYHPPSRCRRRARIAAAVQRPATLTAVLLALAAGSPDLASAADFTLQRTYLGEAPLDQFGIAVAGAGDVDGDGRADFLVGANVNDELILSGGKAYLFLGGPEYPTAAALTFAGDVERGYFGQILTGGGDLNGDGLDDWAVGEPGPGPDGTHPGRVRVFLGGDPPSDVPVLTLTGEVPGGQFGAALALVPDLDGDGHADLVVGCPRAGDGRVFIYRGGPLPLDPTPARVLNARPGDQRFGARLAWLPDRDGDGKDDLLVGVPRNSDGGAWSGAVLLYAGTADLDTVPDLVLQGEAAGDEFGGALAAGHDVDGDGQPDLLVGAPFANAGVVVDAGKTYLYRGGTALDDVADLVLTGAQNEERFGTAVALGFDWNGDAIGDIAVGAPGFDDEMVLDSGRVAVFGGGTLDTVPIAVVPGPRESAHLGTSLAAAGDVVAGSRGVLLAGGYNGTDTGRVLLFGAAPDLTPAPPRPATARLSAPWPNPANPRVSASLHLQRAGRWQVAVHDLRGRRVATLLNGHLPSGEHRIVWDGASDRGAPQPSGIYLLRAEGGGTPLSARVTLVR